MEKIWNCFLMGPVVSFDEKDGIKYILMMYDEKCLMRFSLSLSVIAASNVTSADAPFDDTLNYVTLLDEKTWVADNLLVIFLQCVDTKREKDILEKMRNRGTAPWKVWE